MNEIKNEGLLFKISFFDILWHVDDDLTCSIMVKNPNIFNMKYKFDMFSGKQILENKNYCDIDNSVFKIMRTLLSVSSRSDKSQTTTMWQLAIHNINKYRKSVNPEIVDIPYDLSLPEKFIPKKKPGRKVKGK